MGKRGKKARRHSTTSSGPSILDLCNELDECLGNGQVHDGVKSYVCHTKPGKLYLRICQMYAPSHMQTSQHIDDGGAASAAGSQGGAVGTLDESSSQIGQSGELAASDEGAPAINAGKTGTDQKITSLLWSCQINNTPLEDDSKGRPGSPSASNKPSTPTTSKQVDDATDDSTRSKSPPESLDVSDLVTPATSQGHDSDPDDKWEECGDDICIGVSLSVEERIAKEVKEAEKRDEVIHLS